MRGEEGGFEAIVEAVDRLEARHGDHLKVYDPRGGDGIGVHFHRLEVVVVGFFFVCVF